MKYYETSDFTFSTLLVYHDFPIKETDKSDMRRIVFKFEDSEKLQNVLKDFQDGISQVEPRKFSFSQKVVKSRIYNQ